MTAYSYFSQAFIAFESESAALAGVQSAVVVFDDIPCPSMLP